MLWAVPGSVDEDYRRVRHVCGGLVGCDVVGLEFLVSNSDGRRATLLHTYRMEPKDIVNVISTAVL